MLVLGQKQPLSEIIPGLFVTDEADFWHNHPLLYANNIGTVVSMLPNRIAVWQRKRFTDNVTKDRHLWIQCEDSSTQDLLVYMNQVCELIDQALDPPKISEPLQSPTSDPDPMINKGVIVHCENGVSRSPTMVIAYLMWKKRMSRDEALALIKSRRRVRPNTNFMDQLEVWGQVDFQIWEDEEGMIPKDAYQAYLDRRATRLKEKGLTGNEPIGIVNL